MKEPIAGMDKRKSKAESLYLKGEREWYEGEPGENTRPQRGYSVRTDYPHFAQIPQALIRDPKIKHAAKVLYGIYHTYAQNKDLKNGADTFVSQARVARDMGKGRDRVSHWTQYLHKKGWLRIRPRQGNTNIIILHGKMKRRR